jgi:DNA-binding winged helix-turn-helix (wHTH) protein
MRVVVASRWQHCPTRRARPSLRSPNGLLIVQNRCDARWGAASPTVCREDRLARCYIVGNCEVRPDERRLVVGGEPAAIGSRAFDLLLYLLAHRERVVTKEELLQQVWPGLVVEEGNLTVHVSALRKLLSAQAIVTIPGRGYRFAMPVNEQPATAMVRPTSQRGLATPCGLRCSRCIGPCFGRHFRRFMAKSSRCKATCSGSCLGRPPMRQPPRSPANYVEAAVRCRVRRRKCQSLLQAPAAPIVCAGLAQIDTTGGGPVRCFASCSPRRLRLREVPGAIEDLWPRPVQADQVVPARRDWQHIRRPGPRRRRTRW